MGQGKSEWVSNATIGDISGVGDVLDSIQELSDQLSGQIDILVGVAESAIAIIELSSSIVASGENIEQAVATGAFDVLNSIIESFIDALKEALDFGLYLLPQWEGVDFEKVFRTELISGGKASESIDAEDRFVKVVDKANPHSFHYERARRRGREITPDYSAFVNDVIKSFDDKFDVFRPQQDATQPLSAVIIALAANRISIFVVAYLLVMCFTKDADGVRAVAKSLRKVLHIALGEAEVLAKTVDDDEKKALQKLLELLDDIGSTLTFGISDLIKKLVNHDRGEDTFQEGNVAFTEVKVSGGSGSYASFKEDALENPAISYNNVATLQIKNTGRAQLSVEITDSSNNMRSYTVGHSKSSWEVTVGLDGIALASGGKINTSLEDYAGLHDFATGILTNTETANPIGRPTNIKLTLFPVGETGDLLKDAKAVIKNVAIAKFNIMDNNKNDLRDGFGSYVSYSLDISNADRQSAAKYLGVSKSEVDNKFPVSARGSTNIDISKYGEIDEAKELIVSVNPSVNLNSDFDGVLVVNGTKVDYHKKDIGTSIAKFYYRNVDISSDNNTLYFMPVATKFVDGDKNYTLYGKPEYGFIRTKGGKLSAPTITSGKSVNASDKIVGDLIQINRGKQFTNRYKNLYGKDKGSINTDKQTYTALYNLRGNKAEGKLVYAVIRGLTNPKTGSLAERVELVDFGLGNFYSKNITLEWVDDPTKYQITVYQKDNTGTSKDEIDKATKDKDISHQSAGSSITVEVTNTGASSKSLPPDWVNVSMGSFFPIADPLDGILTDFSNAIKESIPSAPYGHVNDWLDAMEKRLQDFIDLLENLQDIIDNINSILQIGGTGFYFLGIDKANGVEGFKQRLKKVEVPKELSEAKIVTGMVMLTPADLFGVPSGSLMMDTVFSGLPSEGTDSVKVPENQPLTSQIIGTYEKTKLAVESELDAIKTSATKINDIGRDSIAELNKIGRDIE